MKNILVFLSLFLLAIGCSTNDTHFEQIITNPEIIQENDENIDTDPHATGYNGSGFCDAMDDESEFLPDTIVIHDSMPDIVDLSNLMPPVLSQGQQGSCVSWAVTYYLKSYQEKIQHNYEYLSGAEVMSPAFTYNQTKPSDTNCMSGTCIHQALNILKYQGVNTLEDFPYNPSECTTFPTEEQLELAVNNKILNYHKVKDNNLNATKIDLIKSLLIDGIPIIFALNLDADFISTIPKNNEGIYICNELNPTIYRGHAMLLVGYDDELNAFKFVNSWGLYWGNNGYAYLSYNFFLEANDPNYQESFAFESMYIAIDEI